MPNQPRPGKSVTSPYFFECGRCRQRVHVEPNQAGSKLDCGCGVRNVVPSLVHLQRAEAQHERAVQPPAGPRFDGHPQPGSPFAQPIPQQAPSVPSCPFCSRPMAPGRILGDRYQLKWVEGNTPLLLGIWAAAGIPIGRGGFMQFVRPHVWGWRCSSCEKIIVDERA
jgi:hypothetical protein